MKTIVIYYSRGGTTKKMAECIGQQIKKEGGNVDVVSVDKIKAKQLLDYDGIIIGSPTYYGTLAAQIKELIDESVAFHGKLDGKLEQHFLQQQISQEEMRQQSFQF